MGNIFEINDVSKTFGKNKVLDAVDLSVNQGEIVGLLGLNGQGKSTLIKIVLGLLKQNSGKVIKISISNNNVVLCYKKWQCLKK